MEFYLDDCADANDLILLLQRAGHTVRGPREGTRGADDPVHLAHAAARRCTLNTKNPDDFRALHLQWQQEGRAHHGILLIYEENIRGKDMEPADIVRAIGKLLASVVPITNELHVLKEGEEFSPLAPNKPPCKHSSLTEQWLVPGTGSWPLPPAITTESN